MSMKINVDYSGIEEAIAQVEGIGDAANDSAYLSALVNNAHNVASLEFDIDVAASAGPGHLSHMYEFGTLGISQGDGKFIDPTSPAARLWVHGISGEGSRTRAIFFMFREAVAPNPEPTSKYTGVEPEVLARLSDKKFVFRRKAEIIEQGETVHIKPQEKPWNFVPFYGRPKHPDYQDDTHIFRAIAGRRPMVSIPGKLSGMEGTFTAFWATWWRSKGQAFLSGQANVRFNADVIELMKRYPEGVGLKDVVRYNSRGRVYNRRRYYKTRMLAKVAAREKIDRR